MTRTKQSSTMPYKTAKLGKKNVSNASSLPDASGTNFVSPASSCSQGDEGAGATKPSSSSPKKKARAQRPPSPSSGSSASFSSDSDAYASRVVASSSSIDDDSDVFDPTKASDPESETAQRRPSRQSNASGMTTTSSAVDSPLESELDEEDLDIGLNYHAKSASPKKQPSSRSPTKAPAKKRATATPSGKSGKRKRDEYSDTALADSEEDDNSDMVEIDAPSKSRRLGKKGAVKSAPAFSAKEMKQPVKRQRKADSSNIDDSDDERFTVVGKIVQAPTTGRGEQRAKHTSEFHPKTPILCSTSWADFPEHARFPFQPGGSRVQRSRMVQTAWYFCFSYIC